MHVDINEITAVESVSRHQRFDAYRPIHKALRALMGHALVTTGQLDASDVAAVRQLCQDLEQFCDMFASHLEHENTFVHPAIEARTPGASQRIAGEHVQHERDIAALRRRVQALSLAPAAGRAAAAHALYLTLSLFVAHNLAHMYIEETEHNTALWQHYGDDELQAIEGRIVASLSPEETMYAMRWMIPSVTPQERAELLSGVKAGAPAPVLDALMDLARTLLPAAEWSRLAAAIDYADAAGAVNHAR